MLKNKFDRYAHEEAYEKSNFEVASMIESVYLKTRPEEEAKLEELAEEQQENSEENDDEDLGDVEADFKDELGLPDSAETNIKLNP